MEVRIERLRDVPLQVVHTADGDAFYNLADISEHLNVKPDLQNGMQISGQIVWGWRLVGGNFVESVFVDQACAEQLLFEGLTTELQT